MEKLLLPELGHLVQQASKIESRIGIQTSDCDAPIHVDHLARRSAPRVLDADRPADRRGPSGSRLAEAAGRVAAADVTSPIDVPPFVALGDGRLRRHRGRHGGARRRRRRRGCASSSGSTRARLPRVDRQSRHVRRNRDRRADAGRRRRRGDGRGNGAAPASTRSTIRCRGARRPEHRPARRRHRRPAIASSARATLLNPSRVGALAAIGRADVEVYAQAARRRSSRPATRSSSPGSRSAPARSTTSTASRSPRSSRAHGGVAEPHGRRATRSTRSTTRSTRAPTPTSSSSRAAARSASAIWSSTSSPHSGEMIFHGIAVKPGKPTAFALVGTARRSSACRATRRRACRTRTSCSCRSCARPRACRCTRRGRVRAPLGRRIVSQAGRHQFYTVRLENGPRFPPSKARRHHQPVAGRRLHRDSCRSRTVDEGAMVEVTLF